MADFPSSSVKLAPPDVNLARCTAHRKFSDGKTWYRVQVSTSPLSSPKPTSYTIWRKYDHFVLFHSSLSANLKAMPDRRKRLPSLPKSKFFVTKGVCDERVEKLDLYLRDLLAMPETRAHNIYLVREFLGIWPKDVNAEQLANDMEKTSDTKTPVSTNRTLRNDEDDDIDVPLDEPWLRPVQEKRQSRMILQQDLNISLGRGLSTLLRPAAQEKFGVVLDRKEDKSVDALSVLSGYFSSDGFSSDKTEEETFVKALMEGRLQDYSRTQSISSEGQISATSSQQLATSPPVYSPLSSEDFPRPKTLARSRSSIILRSPPALMKTSTEESSTQQLNRLPLVLENRSSVESRSSGHSDSSTEPPQSTLPRSRPTLTLRTLPRPPSPTLSATSLSALPAVPSRVSSLRRSPSAYNDVSGDDAPRRSPSPQSAPAPTDGTARFRATADLMLPSPMSAPLQRNASYTSLATPPEPRSASTTPTSDPGLMPSYFNQKQAAAPLSTTATGAIVPVHRPTEEYFTLQRTFSTLKRKGTLTTKTGREMRAERRNVGDVDGVERSATLVRSNLGQNRRSIGRSATTVRPGMQLRRGATSPLFDTLQRPLPQSSDVPSERSPLTRSATTLRRNVVQQDVMQPVQQVESPTLRRLQNGSQAQAPERLGRAATTVQNRRMSTLLRAHSIASTAREEVWTHFIRIKATLSLPPSTPTATPGTPMSPSPDGPDAAHTVLLKISRTLALETLLHRLRQKFALLVTTDGKGKLMIDALQYRDDDGHVITVEDEEDWVVCCESVKDGRLGVDVQARWD